MRAVAEAHGFMGCDGVLADIGMSSMMVDDPSRGFSFMREGPLDMRMDRTQALTAADVVNTYSEKEIADILYTYGEERRSRADRPIDRSFAAAAPDHGSGSRHRASYAAARGTARSIPRRERFQALRIYINDELKSLETFLDSSMAVVRSGRPDRGDYISFSGRSHREAEISRVRLFPVGCSRKKL